MVISKLDIQVIHILFVQLLHYVYTMWMISLEQAGTGYVLAGPDGLALQLVLILKYKILVAC